MQKHLILIALLILTFAQLSCSNQPTNNTDLEKKLPDTSITKNQQTNFQIADTTVEQIDQETKIFTQAISEYIKAVYRKDKTKIDTLLFGKHVDFPEIELPETIEHTTIMVVSTEEADEIRKHRPTLMYINLFGWVSEENAEFIFVTFFPDYKHQYDYFIDFTFNTEQKEFELEKIEFENYFGFEKPKRVTIYEDGKYVDDK